MVLESWQLRSSSSPTNLEKRLKVGSLIRCEAIAGEKSDDGHVWIGGAAYRMNPDGTDVEVIGHNFRNSYEQKPSHLLEMFQNDNDDPPASRTTLLRMEMPDSVQRTANEAGSLIAVQVNRLKSPNGDKKILEQYLLPVTFMEEALQQRNLLL